MISRIDRRTFLGLAAYASAARWWLGPSVATAAPAGSAPPFASFTQRVLVDRLLAADPGALVAFGQAAQAVSDRANVFARAQSAFKAAPPADRVRMLAEQLGHGLGLDLRATLSSGASGAIGDFAQATIARTGLQLVVGASLDASGLRKVLGGKTINDISTLLGGVASALDTRPVFGDIKDAAGALRRLEQTAKDQGLLGLIAGAGASLSKLTDPEQSKKLGKELASLTNEAGKFLKGGLDFKKFPSLDGLANAVQTVGTLVKADPATINTITKVIRTVGAVAQGVQMGASFGPIGAVVGGAIGLVTSLFGGEPARDPTLEALSAIDSKLVQIHADMVAGINALSKQIQEGFLVVTTALNDLRVSLGTLHQQMLREFDDLKTRLHDVARDPHLLTVTKLEIAAGEHERAYRTHAVDPLSRRFETTASEARTRAEEVAFTLETAGGGFASSAIVGTGSLAGAITQRLLKPAAAHLPNTLLPLDRRFLGRAIDRGAGSSFSHAMTPLGSQLYPGGPPPVPRLLRPIVAYPPVSPLASDICTAIRDTQYRHPDTMIGAPLIHQLHLQLIDSLAGLDTSPEAKYMSAEQRSWIPSRAGVAAKVQPISPEDLVFVASTVGAAITRLNDPTLVTELIEICLPRLRARVANHALFTDQSMAVPLLYARRSVARRLATLVAEVFCSRAMTAARVLRCATSSVLSKAMIRSHDHATLQLNRQSAAALFSTTSMPLHRYNKTQLGTEPKPLTLALDEIYPALSSTPAPLDQAQTATLWKVVGSRGPELAQVFVDDLKRAGSGALLDHLGDIISTGVLLATIEAAIELRLAVLNLAKISTPTFRSYVDGFEEFVLLAAHAAYTAQNTPAGDANLTAATVLVLGHLAQPVRDIAVAAGPPLPVGSQPYPIELGYLWGWGADDFALDYPAGDDLIRALTDPHCALAGSNSAIQRAATVCLTLESAGVEITLARTAAQRLPPADLIATLKKAVS